MKSAPGASTIQIQPAVDDGHDDGAVPGPEADGRRRFVAGEIAGVVGGALSVAVIVVPLLASAMRTSSASRAVAAFAILIVVAAGVMYLLLKAFRKRGRRGGPRLLATAVVSCLSVVLVSAVVGVAGRVWVGADENAEWGSGCCLWPWSSNDGEGRSSSFEAEPSRVADPSGSVSSNVEGAPGPAVPSSSRGVSGGITHPSPDERVPPTYTATGKAERDHADLFLWTITEVVGPAGHPKFEQVRATSERVWPGPLAIAPDADGAWRAQVSFGAETSEYSGLRFRFTLVAVDAATSAMFAAYNEYGVWQTFTGVETWLLNGLVMARVASVEVQRL